MEGNRFDYDPKNAAHIFCNCMTRELTVHPRRIATKICGGETEKASYYFEMFEDSMHSGRGFSRQSLTDSAKGFMTIFGLETLDCRFLDGKGDPDTIPPNLQL